MHLPIFIFPNLTYPFVAHLPNPTIRNADLSYQDSFYPIISYLRKTDHSLGHLGSADASATLNAVERRVS